MWGSVITVTMQNVNDLTFLLKIVAIPYWIIVISVLEKYWNCTGISLSRICEHPVNGAFECDLLLAHLVNGAVECHLLLA